MLLFVLLTIRLYDSTLLQFDEPRNVSTIFLSCNQNSSMTITNTSDPTRFGVQGCLVPLGVRVLPGKEVVYATSDSGPVCYPKPECTQWVHEDAPVIIPSKTGTFFTISKEQQAWVITTSVIFGLAFGLLVACLKRTYCDDCCVSRHFVRL